MLRALGQSSELQAVLLIVTAVVLGLVVLPVTLSVSEARQGPVHRFLIRHERGIDLLIAAVMLAGAIAFCLRGEWSHAFQLLTIAVLVVTSSRQLRGWVRRRARRGDRV